MVELSNERVDKILHEESQKNRRADNDPARMSISGI